jgi:hypothetical protein
VPATLLAVLGTALPSSSSSRPATTVRETTCTLRCASRPMPHCELQQSGHARTQTTHLMATATNTL